MLYAETKHYKRTAVFNVPERRPSYERRACAVVVDERVQRAFMRTVLSEMKGVNERKPPTSAKNYSSTSNHLKKATQTLSYTWRRTHSGTTYERHGIWPISHSPLTC